VQWAYAVAGAALPRDARDQITATRHLAAGETPRAGDLLFFGRQGAVNHVAIVVAPPRFVHAYGRVEVATLRRSGRGARPELRSICLGLRRPLLFP
jgi:cell wall-associated NlpC family hydrolase